MRHGEIRKSRRHRKLSTVRQLIGKTSRRVKPRQIAASRCTPSSVGSPPRHRRDRCRQQRGALNGAFYAGDPTLDGVQRLAAILARL